jgi:L-malate glycosyltransferase
LVIVGDGPARDEIERRASRGNAVAGRRAVSLTGFMDDPRPAYAAADVVLGMGGSALRDMAFGKPLIVQGELGFWKLCTPETVEEFLEAGWFGLGNLAIAGDETGIAAGAEQLRAELEPLINDQALRNDLGRFGRTLIEARFNLEGEGNRAGEGLQRGIGKKEPSSLFRRGNDGGGSGIHYVRRKVRKWLGTEGIDDFHEISHLRAASIDRDAT